MQTLFPCFAGGGDDGQAPIQHDQLPAKPKQERVRSPSKASTYAAKIPVSEGPAPQQSPIYRPDIDKKLPPRPRSASDVIELPGSSPNLHEMPAPHVPETHPLARPSNAGSTDFSRPSQQLERNPHSPFSAQSTLTAGSAAGSTYQRSGSIRTASERDPDEITPVATNSNAYDYGMGARANMYHNVTDALTDRKRMFERLRRANGTEQQQQSRGSVRSAAGTTSQSFGAVTAVEMEAPVRAPSELAARENVGYSSAPRELE